MRDVLVTNRDVAGGGAATFRDLRVSSPVLLRPVSTTPDGHGLQRDYAMRDVLVVAVIGAVVGAITGGLIALIWREDDT